MPEAVPKPKPRLVVCRVPIRDGFTQSDTYDGAAARYRGTAIAYRPALQDQCAEFLDDPRKYVVKARDMIVKHVTGWNVANDDGNDVAPINPVSAAELAYPILSWMVDCITGYAPQVEVEEAKN